MLNNILSQLLPNIIKIRQQIHNNPELSFSETNTAELIVEELSAYGIKHIQTNVGKTGVVAEIDSGKPGKIVALRADFDALPMQEKTGKTYASSKPNVMHACGHDGHTATLLGAANLLNQLRHQFTGKIKLIFQPAEEIGAGAKAMITENVLQDVDAIFGYHNFPGELGKICVKSATIMAGIDLFKIIVQGKGGHASQPQICIDPVLIGSHIVVALQSLISRRIAATDNAVITVAQFNAGSKENIIADEAVLKGSMRTVSNEQREFLIKEMTMLTENIAHGLGGKVIIEIEQGPIPVINSAAETDLVIKVAKEQIGADAVINLTHPMMASEDFCYFLEKIPGCFFFIGTGAGIECENHNGHYDFNDAILPTAIRMMSGVALAFLQN